MTQPLIASILHLDRRAVKALRITDPYSIHRVVYSLFEDVRSAEQKQTSKASGIVFADQGGDVAGRRILMLSNRSPAATVDGQWGEVRSKPIPDQFLSHDCYRFQIAINPTRRDSRSRKLVPVKGKEAVGQWFAERAPENWGFRVNSDRLQVERIEVLQFADKQQRPVTLAKAHLTGVLDVTDRESFQQSFANGIGRGRAFGCGLLQIVPIIENPLV